LYGKFDVEKFCITDRVSNLHKNGGKIGLILNRMEGIFLGDW
jgi:hypothetical protein